MPSRLPRDSGRSVSFLSLRDRGSARWIALATAVTGAAWLTGAPSLRAQQVEQVQVQVAAQPDLPGAQGKENTQNVYVRDSAIAQEKFALAMKMQKLKEWNKSADLYQEIVEKYHDRVIPMPGGVDAKGVIVRYTSVSWAVLGQLSKWPQEGLDVYRGRYEPKAADLVQNARPDDLFSLHKAFDLYFVTESGKQAGLRLIDAHLEHGEYAAAAWIGDQLLDLHPGLLAERPGVLFRTSLAYALAGNKDKAAERASKLQADFPKEMGVVQGKDVVLSDRIQQLLQQVGTSAPDTAVAAIGSGDSWPMIGGNPARSLVSSAHASAGTRLFSVPLVKPDYKNQPQQQKVLLQNQLEMANQNGNTLGIMPVVDRGELYFQDGVRVYAVSLDSGLPLPGWAQTYAGAQNGQYVIRDAWGAPRTSQQSLTLTDRSVLAVMGQPDRHAALVGLNPQGEPRLVCLDRTTGNENWVVTLSNTPDIPRNDDEKAIRALQMSGSPLVVGDNVLVIGRSNKPGQGEDCYVLAFDLANGHYRWGCYVASSGMGAAMMYGQIPSPGENTSHLAYADGRVYVLTNLGALAALDAYSGTIAWLNIYPLDRPEMAANWRGNFNPGWQQAQNPGSSSRLKPWMFNPAVAYDGKLFILPTEGKHLMIYDAATGKEVKRINLDQLGRWYVRQNQQPDKPTTLVGISGDRMLLAGETRVLCLDWKAYDEDKFPGPNDDMILWPSSVPGSIRGRPFMSGDAVYVSADDRLRKLDMKTGSAIEEYPKFPRSWEDGEGPGNVLVTSDHVIVAGASGVDVYTDLKAAKERLDHEIAAAPNDPDARLRYAEVMFVAGQSDLSLQRLDEAIALLGGIDHMPIGATRDRIFNDALTFAQKSLIEERPGEERAPSPERVTQLFDRAAAAASAPQQQVHYRIARAKFEESLKTPAAAVKLYQEILSDAKMRAVALTDDQAGSPTQAADVAEHAIEQLIHASGVSIYAPYQEQAAKAFADAQAETDPAAAAGKLLAVAQVYPNSDVAPKSILAAADSYESAHQPRNAIRVLREMWFKYTQSPNRAQIVEGIARNYLAIPDRNRAEAVSAAAARLMQGSQLPGDPKLTRPLKLPDGTMVADAGVTFADALEAVRKVSSREADKAIPDFRMPVPRPGERPYPKPFAGMKPRQHEIIATDVPVLEGATTLVLPDRDFARSDRILAWSPAGLGIYKPGETKPAAINKSFPNTGAGAADAPRGVAWAGDVALVWGGGGRLAAIEADTGTAKWQIDFTRLTPVEVVRMNDGGQAPQPMDPNNVIVNGGGQIFINGNVRFQQRVILNARGVAQVQMGVQPAAGVQPGQPAPGQPAPPVANGGEQVVSVRPVGDRVLVTTTTGRVLSAELATGNIAWQTRFSDRAPDRLAATEDFTVLQTSDDVAVRLSALDTYSGRLLGTKPFYTQAGGATPVNLALAPDGTLVYTLPDRLCLRDLYKNWSEDEKVVTAAPPGQPGLPLYAGATQPGQLVVSEGRILAVADSGSTQGLPPNEKYVRIHSLETGQPLQLQYEVAADGTKRKIDRLLTAGTKDWNVMLRTVGPHLYVIGPQTVFSYNLDHPAETWKGSTNTLEGLGRNDANFRDAFIGQSYLVVLDQPVPGPGIEQAGAKYRLHAFGRYHQEGAPPGESGRLDHIVDLGDPSGIQAQWQAADSGFYFATGDGKVHMLLGAKP